MDNRLNKLRKEMSVLRAEMLRAEDVMRDQVNRDHDCTGTALRLMEMRARMSALVREWTMLGGCAHLPTVDERLRERRGPSTKPKTRSAPPPRKRQKRRLVARA